MSVNLKEASFDEGVVTYEFELRPMTRAEWKRQQWERRFNRFCMSVLTSGTPKGDDPVAVAGRREIEKLRAVVAMIATGVPVDRKSLRRWIEVKRNRDLAASLESQGLPIPEALFDACWLDGP